jgi:hypothetical protein
MCWPTLIAMVVIGCFFLYLVFLSVVAFAHFVLGAPLATDVFNRLLGRKSGVLDVFGRPVTFTHRTKGKNGESRLQLEFTGNFSARAVFHTETRSDRLGKDYGLNQEVQLNDPSFDQAVYIECDDASFVRSLLETGEAKQKLKTLLESFTSLEFKGESCVLTKNPCDDFDAISMPDLVSAAMAMLALADRIAPAGQGQATLTPLTESRSRAEAVFTAGGVALSICGALVAFWGAQSFEPVLPWQVFKTSLYAALALGLVFAAHIYLRFKGTSTGLRAFRKSLAFGGTGIVLWCWGWLMVLNGSQDVSAAAPHEVKIVSKHISSGKGGGFTLGLSSWSKDLEKYKINPRRKEFELLEIGDTCVISVRKGYFGFEWIDGKLCQGRGRALGSGTAAGVSPGDSWRLSGGFFREIPI